MDDVQQNQAQTLPPLHDTPPKEKHASGKEYRGEHLESSRSEMLKDVGGIPIVSFELFKRFLPPPPSETCHVKARLVRQGDLTPYGWRLWPKPPAQLKTGENEVFQAFAKLINDIIEAITSEGNGAWKPTVSQLNNPNLTPLSARRSSSKPDGYLRLLPGANDDTLPPFAKLMHELREKRGVNPKDSGSVFWEDIGGAEEYNKGNTASDRADVRMFIAELLEADGSALQDERKILWSLHHILRNDPCRRFAFGITVENKNVRVWLMHRAGAVVSEAFSFMDDVDDFIYLVSSLAFASRTNLGWDPTIVAQLVGEGKEARIAHRITVETYNNTSEDYLTTALISDFAANAIPGRGTRVFEVQKVGVGESKGPFVLKDSWLDFDRPHEGSVMKDLMDDLRGLEGPNMSDVKQHFLTVLCYGSVLAGGAVDSTLQTIMHGVDVPVGSTILKLRPFDLSVSEKSSGGSGGVGELPLIPETTEEPRRLHHRVHHRIVFEERGQSLHAIQDLKVRLNALVDVARAIGFLWRCRWLHRDVSPGNVLVFEGRGILMDFEYAKKYVDGEIVKPVHEVRTGTSNYMAIEIDTRMYQFTDVQHHAPVEPPLLKYNALHDIESHWWVTVWSIISLRVQHATTGSYDVRKHRAVFSRMYPRPSNESRTMFMLWNNFTAAVNAKTFSAEFTEAVDELESLRSNLKALYKEAYAPFLRGEEADMAVFDKAHSPQLESIKETAKKVRLIPSNTKIVPLWD